jgi:general control protein GCN4
VSQPSNGSANQQPRQKHALSASPSLQNQQVARIIQDTGLGTSSPAYTNRFSSQQQQFYASSAPSSTVAVNQNGRSQRPPVPLFTNSTGSVPQVAGKMNLGIDLDDFPSLEGGGNTSYSSPAMHGVYDLDGHSSSASNMGTVSPQDLLLQDPFMSAPNSTSLTALTTPSSVYQESPDYHDGYDVSPSFGSNDFDTGSADTWFPLFGGPTAPAQPLAQPHGLESSPEEQLEELDVVDTSRSGHRRKSSLSAAGKHSSVSGVNSRRRDKPLPPIVVEDPSDTTAMKRARNTLAARKSRERKAQRLEDLEEKIAKLEQERDYWKSKATSQR